MSRFPPGPAGRNCRTPRPSIGRHTSTERDLLRMALAARTAARAAAGFCALWCLLALSACEGALGTSPPHAAPANPICRGPATAQVELTWGAGHGRHPLRDPLGQRPGRRHIRQSRSRASRTRATPTTGLENFRQYRYKIVAETSGGRGPESLGRRGDSGTGAGLDRVDRRDRPEPGPHDLFPDDARARPITASISRASSRSSSAAVRTHPSSRPMPRLRSVKTSRHDRALSTA